MSKVNFFKGSELVLTVSEIGEGNWHVDYLSYPIVDSDGMNLKVGSNFILTEEFVTFMDSVGLHHEIY